MARVPIARVIRSAIARALTPTECRQGQFRTLEPVPGLRYLRDVGSYDGGHGFQDTDSGSSKSWVPEAGWAFLTPLLV
jgi:hypothetical protein